MLNIYMFINIVNIIFIYTFKKFASINIINYYSNTI